MKLHTARFVRYVWPVFNITHERVKEIAKLSCCVRLASSPAHLFALKKKKKRGPGALQTLDQDFP